MPPQITESYNITYSYNNLKVPSMESITVDIIAK